LVIDLARLTKFAVTGQTASDLAG